MKDVIIDFETLGKGSERDDFIVLDVAFLRFDIEAQDDFDDLVSRVKEVKFLVQEQLDIGWKAEKDTLEWWKSQPKELQKISLFPSDKDVTLQTFVDEFKKCLGSKTNTKRLWARGTDFDLPILKRIFRQCGDDINNSIWYNCATDTRTYMKAMTQFKIRDDFIPPKAEGIDFKKHVAAHDIAMDVMRIQAFND